MKFVFISDTHLRHREIELPDGDVLIHCGDLTGIGKVNSFTDVGLWFEEQKSRYKHRIFIAGNHDFGLQTNREEVLHTKFDSDIIYLEESEIVIDGVKIYGTPWTPLFYNWAFMAEDIDLVQRYAKIPIDTNILISHGPPYSILDRNQSGDMCGSRAMLQRVMDLALFGNLKHHCFGHIHEQGGISEVIEGIQFNNVSSLDRQYEYRNKPIIIEL